MKASTLLLSAALAVSLLAHAVLWARRRAEDRPSKPPAQPALAPPPRVAAAPVEEPPAPAPAAGAVERTPAAELPPRAVPERATAPPRPAPAAFPPAYDAVLEKPMDARFRNCTALEFLEHLREETKLSFLYDPLLYPRLEAARITLDIANAKVRDVLDFLQEILGFDVDYLNERVWLKLRPE